MIFGALGELAFGELDGATYYIPTSRVTSGGTFQPPSSVPTLIFAINCEDGTAITLEDGSILELES